MNLQRLLSNAKIHKGTKLLPLKQSWRNLLCKQMEQLYQTNRFVSDERPAQRRIAAFTRLNWPSDTQVVCTLIYMNMIYTNEYTHTHTFVCVCVSMFSRYTEYVYIRKNYINNTYYSFLPFYHALGDWLNQLVLMRDFSYTLLISVNLKIHDYSGSTVLSLQKRKRHTCLRAHCM